MVTLISFWGQTGYSECLFKFVSRDYVCKQDDFYFEISEVLVLTVFLCNITSQLG